MEVEFSNDESETWEEFFGSSTDLGPSLIGFFDKLTSPINKRNAVSLNPSGANIQEYQTTGVHKNPHKSRIINPPTAEQGNHHLRSNSNDNVIEAVNASAIHRLSYIRLKQNGDGSKKVKKNFSFLSPNVQRIISNSTTSLDNVDDNVSSYKVPVSSRSHSQARKGHNNFPLSSVTCKLSQSNTEVNNVCDNVETNKSPMIYVTNKYIDSGTFMAVPEETVHSLNCSDFSDNQRCSNISGDHYDVTLVNSSVISSSTIVETNEQYVQIDENYVEDVIVVGQDSKLGNQSELSTPTIEITGGEDAGAPEDLAKDTTEFLVVSRTEQIFDDEVHSSNQEVLSAAENNSRPLSMSSIGSSSSISSGGVGEGTYRGEGGSEYLASVESLADHSENEYAGNKMAPLSLGERACLELIHTEQNYVSDLKQVVQGYLNSWREKSALTEPQLTTLFSNINEIYHFNSDLLEKLWASGKDPVQIARVFSRCRDGFDVYTEYCTHYPHAISLLTDLLQSKITSGLLRETQSNLGHRLPLGSYLLKPVQRIMKYHLLLQNLCKHYDSAEIEDSLHLMTGVAHHIDQVKRKLEQQSRVQELAGSLDGWLGPSLSVLGELCLEGTLQERNHKPRQVFLFDKMLLLTKRKEDGRLAYKSHIMCSNLMLVESVQGEPTSFHVIPYDNPRSQCTLQARSVQQKKQWGHQLKRVMLEQYKAEIPNRAKDLVLKLGNDDDLISQEKPILSKRTHSAPEYLERRHQLRKSDMARRRVTKGRKLDLTSPDSVPTEVDSSNGCMYRGSPNLSTCSKFSNGQEESFKTCSDEHHQCKEKRYSSWYLNEEHNLENPNFTDKLELNSHLDGKKYYSTENVIDSCSENSLKATISNVNYKRVDRKDINKAGSWRRKSEPGIPSSFFTLNGDQFNNSTKCLANNNVNDEMIGCIPLFAKHEPRSVTLGHLKPPIRSFEIKQYNAKTLPKKISKLKKNRAKHFKHAAEAQSKFYMDLSDFSTNENVLHISESNDSISAPNLNVETVIPEEEQVEVPDNSAVDLISNCNSVQCSMQDEQNTSDIKQTPERHIEEIISQLLMQKRVFRKLLNKSKREHPLAKSLSNPEPRTAVQAEVSSRGNIPSRKKMGSQIHHSTPDLLEHILTKDQSSSSMDQPDDLSEEPIYESLVKIAIDMERKTPVVSEKVYRDVRIKYRKKSSARPESDYVTLKYTSDGILKPSETPENHTEQPSLLEKSNGYFIKNTKPRAIRPLNLMDDPKLKSACNIEDIDFEIEKLQNLDLQNEIDKIIEKQKEEKKATDVSESLCQSNSKEEFVEEEISQLVERVANRPVFSRNNSKSLIQRFRNIMVEDQPPAVKSNSDSLLNKRRSENVKSTSNSSSILATYKQGSKNLGSRIAHVDYADPKMIFPEFNQANLFINKNSLRPDSLFSFTSSNDSVFDPRSFESKSSPSKAIELEHNQNSVAPSSQNCDLAINNNLSNIGVGYYEKSVEDMLENDSCFRDSAIYSDDNERKGDCCEGRTVFKNLTENISTANVKKAGMVDVSCKSKVETKSLFEYQTKIPHPVRPGHHPPLPIKPDFKNISPQSPICSQILHRLYSNSTPDDFINTNMECTEIESDRNSTGWVKHVIGKFQ